MNMAVASTSSIVELLEFRALETPDHTACVFLENGEIETERLSYSQLVSQATSVAAFLHDQDFKPGERIILAFAPGTDFIVAFFGCLFAGLIAVPVHPPQGRSSADALDAIIQNSKPAAVLTHAPVADLLSSRIASHSLRTINLADVNIEQFDSPFEFRISSESIAFLQYTSGSTSIPKGVMIKHSSLIADVHMIAKAARLTDQSTVLSWAPQYHDMGLIGGIILPLYIGASCIVMPPHSFIEKPVRWLRAISEYKAHVSPSPNFGYELCVRRIKPADLADVDLSSWRLAFNGAEPVRPDTLRRFTEAFSPYGFHHESHYPVYGLAETVVLVSSGVEKCQPRVLTLNSEDFSQGIVRETQAGDVVTAVACGRPFECSKVAIVNPDTCAKCNPDEIGEVWVSGLHVAAGYWDRPEESEKIFQAKLQQGDDDSYLRTGDLGFIHEGELFIAGRLKDVIIIRGRNFYPQDIEFTIEESHSDIRKGCSAAFSIDRDGEEQLVVVCEATRNQRSDDLSRVVAAARANLVETYRVQPYDIVIVEAGTVSKTSSGKIQRAATREAYLSGSLLALVCYKKKLNGNGHDKPTVNELVSVNYVDRSTQRQRSFADWISNWIESKLQFKEGLLDHDKQFGEIGFDSVTAAELVADINECHSMSLRTEIPWTFPTINSLAKYLANHQQHDSNSQALSVAGPESSPSPVGASSGCILNSQATGRGPLDGTLADYRVVSGWNFEERASPFLEWQQVRKATSLWPYSRELESEPRATVMCTSADGSTAEGINFASIDYLGLSSHPAIKEAAQKTIRDFGVHSASVPIFTGLNKITRQLTQDLSELLNLQHVTLFPTGWTAGWGAIAGLVRESDHIVMDELAHNCMQHGARAATSRIIHFRHNSVEDAELRLARIRSKDRENGILVVTEGLYSMDSDWPDLFRLQQICREYNARLLVDISHDIGSMGPCGSGQIGAQRMSGKIDYVIGGLSKGLAANAGFFACNSEALSEYVRCYSDAYLFGTAFSPIAASVASAAIRIVRSEEGESLRSSIERACIVMRRVLTDEGLTCIGDVSPILPVVIGSESLSRLSSRSALRNGVITNVVEFPAVPLGKARLRLQLMAQHTSSDVEHAARVIAKSVKESQNELGVLPA